MSGSSLEFYADKKDLEVLFSIFKEFLDYKYIQSISELNADNIETDNPSMLLEYLVTEGSPNQTNVFLCTNIDTKIVSMPVNMKVQVGVKYRVDQVFNPDSSEILLGGQVDENLIVNTTIRTTGETPLAKKIFKALKSVIVKNSKKIKSFYVMPSAYEKFSNGVRLAQGKDFHPDYDLKR